MGLVGYRRWLLTGSRRGYYTSLIGFISVSYISCGALTDAFAPQRKF